MSKERLDKILSALDNGLDEHGQPMNRDFAWYQTSDGITRLAIDPQPLSFAECLAVCGNKYNVEYVQLDWPDFIKKGLTDLNNPEFDEFRKELAKPENINRIPSTVIRIRSKIIRKKAADIKPPTEDDLNRLRKAMKDANDEHPLEEE